MHRIMLALLLGAVLGFGPGRAVRADVVLRIDTVPGDLRTGGPSYPASAGWLKVLSAQVHQGRAAGGATAPTIGPITIQRPLWSVASIKLAELVATQRRVPTATIEFLPAYFATNPSPYPFYRMQLFNVSVRRLESSAGSEQIELAFDRIAFQYFLTSGAVPTQFGWDAVTRTVF
jgi:type VI protein secretion system component Hcp